MDVADQEADGKTETFQCRIRKVAVVSIHSLRRWVERGEGEVPSEALQVTPSLLPPLQHVHYLSLLSHAMCLYPRAWRQSEVYVIALPCGCRHLIS